MIIISCGINHTYQRSPYDCKSVGRWTEFYSITDKNNVWEEFTQGRKDLEIIKSFVYLKVRLMFDPPQNSFLVDSIEKQISEYEWRITVQTNKLVEVGDTI